MTTVVQTTHTQPGAYPPTQQGYPPSSGYQQPGYPPQQQHVTHIQSQAPPTTTVTNVPAPDGNGRYNKNGLLVTGILQIIAAGLLILFGIIALALGSWYQIGWSIWGGICFYVVAGILGIVSRGQSRCVIIAYMVMSIISAVCAGSQMIYDAAAAGNTRYMGYAYCDGYWYGTCSRLKSIMAMHSLSAMTGLAELIIAILGSGYCCAGCCGTQSPPQTTVVSYAQPVPTPQVTVVSAASYPPQTSYNQNQASMNAPPPAYAQQAQPMPQQPSMYPEPMKL